MKQFEVETIHQSNVILDKESFIPFKYLQFKVKLNFEAQTDLLATGPSQEEIGQKLSDAIVEAFNKLPHSWHLNKNTSPAEEKERAWYEVFGDGVSKVGRAQFIQEEEVCQTSLEKDKEPDQPDHEALYLNYTILKNITRPSLRYEVIPQKENEFKLGRKTWCAVTFEAAATDLFDYVDKIYSRVTLAHSPTERWVFYNARIALQSVTLNEGCCFVMIFDRCKLDDTQELQTNMD